MRDKKSVIVVLKALEQEMRESTMHGEQVCPMAALQWADRLQLLWHPTPLGYRE